MGRTRNNKIECRVTDEEKEIYLKMVEKSRLSKQEYNYRCIFNKDIIVIDGIYELANQLRRIGVNVNQIAHMVNVRDNVFKSDIEELADQVNECWKLVNDFVKQSKVK